MTERERERPRLIRKKDKDRIVKSKKERKGKEGKTE